MTSYNSSSKLLHWVVAIGMIVIAALGVYMESFEAYAWYGFHKSVGMLLLIVILIRVFKRLKEGFSESSSVRWQRVTAKAVHLSLLIVTLLFPISGMMMSIGGGRGADIFGLTLISPNIDSVTEKVTPINETVASLGAQAHGLLLDALVVLLFLHVGAALKHHFVNNNDVLSNMISFKGK